MVAFAVTLIYAIFAVFEIISLKKMNQTKELVTFCILLGAAYVLSMLLVFDVKIPSYDRMVGDLILPLVEDLGGLSE